MYILCTSYKIVSLNYMRRSKIEPSFFLPDSISGANLKRMSKTAQAPRKKHLN
jgi:hypothetical protein